MTTSQKSVKKVAETDRIAYTTNIYANKNKKKRTNEVNEIEKIYVKEGIYSTKFIKHLINFIGFVLNRYSNGASFPDDMVHFTYLRIMERLGASVPEKPKEPVRIKKCPDGSQIEIDAIEEWELNGKQCLFDVGRSNLGNYIFSIARNAHSNFTYHASKQAKELDPPPVELPEEGEDYDPDICNSEIKSLEILEFESEFIPENLRRYIAWKQNN